MFHAMQRLAHCIIPDLVSYIYNVGFAEASDGRVLQYSIIEFVQGKTLEDTWEQLSTENRESIILELTKALANLHSVKIGDDIVKTNLWRKLSDPEVQAFIRLDDLRFFGGQHTGYIHDGVGFLKAIMERRKILKPFCTLESRDDSKDVTITSRFEGLGSLTITNAEMEDWRTKAVFCHNGPNPRNLILKSYVAKHGGTEYKLAGIIDWELAGFYPPAYELRLQDMHLDTATRYVSFYLLLKDYMQSIVPRSEAQIKLLKAMELIRESQQRALSDGTDGPAQVRERFLRRAGLVRDDDPYIGWTRGKDARNFGLCAAFQNVKEDIAN